MTTPPWIKQNVLEHSVNCNPSQRSKQKCINHREDAASINHRHAVVKTKRRDYTNSKTLGLLCSDRVKAGMIFQNLLNGSA